MVTTVAFLLDVRIVKETYRLPFSHGRVVDVQVQLSPFFFHRCWLRRLATRVAYPLSGPSHLSILNAVSSRAGPLQLLSVRL